MIKTIVLGFLMTTAIMFGLAMFSIYGGGYNNPYFAAILVIIGIFTLMGALGLMGHTLFELGRIEKEQS